MAMLERGLEVGEDVDRSIMSKEVSLFLNSFCYAVRGEGVDEIKTQIWQQ